MSVELTKQSQVSADADQRENALEVLTWRRHFLVEEPQRLLVLLGCAAFCTIVAWLLFRNPLFCLAALLMLASATGEYFFPISYRLTGRAAECKYGASRIELEWTKVRRALLYSDGVRLSPLPAASRLDAFRGIYLRFAPDGHPGDRDSVLAAIATLRPARNTEVNH